MLFFGNITFFGGISTDRSKYYSLEHQYYQLTSISIIFVLLLNNVHEVTLVSTVFCSIFGPFTISRITELSTEKNYCPTYEPIIEPECLRCSECTPDMILSFHPWLLGLPFVLIYFIIYLNTVALANQILKTAKMLLAVTGILTNVINSTHLIPS